MPILDESGYIFLQKQLSQFCPWLIQTSFVLYAKKDLFGVLRLNSCLWLKSCTMLWLKYCAMDWGHWDFDCLISDWLSGSWTQDHLAVWLENWLVYLLHYSTLTAIKSSKWKKFSFGWVKPIYIVVNYFHASRFESCFFKVKDNWNVLSLSNSNSIPGQNDLICRGHESYKCAYLILNKQQSQCLKVWGRLWIPS